MKVRIITSVHVAISLAMQARNNMQLSQFLSIFLGQFTIIYLLTGISINTSKNKKEQIFLKKISALEILILIPLMFINLLVIAFR